MATTTPNERTNAAGDPEYRDADGFWMDERNTCQHCLEERRAAGLPFRWADEQYSFGCYAGRYCEVCWPRSGFRDATDPDARFDPMDAGESLDEEPDYGGAFDGFRVYSDADPGL